MNDKKRLLGRGIISFGVVLTVAAALVAVSARTEGGQADAAGSPTYDLSWHTIDGGGVMFSTGGDYELSGTIGQHDAGGPMAAGGFELTGGFWFPLAPGDCNEDGGVNLFDYDPFADCALGVDVGPLSSECACFDLDGDDDVDMEDFGGFQRRFSGS